MSNMTLNDRVKIAGDVVYQKVGEEMVLLDLKSGCYYGLDEVGSRMWELLMENGSLSNVLEVMAKEFEVPRENLERDILRMIGEFEAKGLVGLEG